MHGDSSRDHTLTPHAASRRKSRWLIVLIIAVLVAVGTGIFHSRDQIWGIQGQARAAANELKHGKLEALEESLSEHRGEPEFAYYFTTKVTPRDLGDALATVAGSSSDSPLKMDVDADAYELSLTDLAGTLALATHGFDDLALPTSWTSEFIAATTVPSDLYGTHDGFFDSDGKLREKQDLANKANLLLLLSRGYWSQSFLEQVTAAYHAFDLREGDKAWPEAHPSEDIGYAPSPNGVYLTDGILALTAALTANPAASEWAFTDFDHDEVQIEGTDYTVGAFTHFLLFEHKFPETADSSVGTSASLTALSSAIDSASWATGVQQATEEDASSDIFGPLHDASVLQVVAKSAVSGSDCSWHPSDYWTCLESAARAVWQWVQQWGHTVLDILSLTAFAPPPFNAVGFTAAATNATWYAIDGDYLSAGLSLVAVAPAAVLPKILQKGEAGIAAGKTAKGASESAKAAEAIRAGADPAATRAALTPRMRDEILAKAPKTPDGKYYLDANTGEPIIGVPIPDIGHKPGFEWKCTQLRARAEHWTREMIIAHETKDLSIYQVEDPHINRSHLYEAPCTL